MHFKTYPITYSLIALNCLVYLITTLDPSSIAGMSPIQFKLALYPAAMYLHNEWWRLLTSVFVHGSLIHLLGNMFALLIFSNFVERAFGSGYYFFIYFIGGIGANLIAYSYAVYFNLANYVAIGASGAVLAIFGAGLALFIYTSKYAKNAQQVFASKQMINRMLAMAVIQTIIDITNEQSSFLHHVSGFIIGFILAGFLLMKQRNNKKY